MNNRDLTKFVALKAKIAAKEGEVEALKESIKELEARLIENMCKAGIQRTTINGSTVYIHRKLWASAAKEETRRCQCVEARFEEGVEISVADAACLYCGGLGQILVGGGTAALAAALREEGLEDLVSEAVNAHRLSAWVREHDPEKATPPDEVVARLPPRVQGAIRVSEVYKLGVRKAS